MSLVWIAGAGILAVSSFVFGLAGFGIGLVSLSLLPFFIPPATAVPLVTVYSTAFALVMARQLRRHVLWSQLLDLLLGSAVGALLGVWVLTALSPGMLRRLIGVVLMVVVVIELRGLYPQHLAGRGWGLGAGFLAGLLGGAVGTPGPPARRLGAQHGVTARGPRSSSGGLGRRGGGAGGEKGLYFPVLRADVRPLRSVCRRGVPRLSVSGHPVLRVPRPHPLAADDDLPAPSSI